MLLIEKKKIYLGKLLIHFTFYRAMAGNASVYLPVVHFTLLIYSQPVADFIKESGFDLEAKNDYSFMKNVLNMLTSLFEFAPPFKIEEFFAPGTAIDRKVSFIITLIQMVKAKDA